MNPSRLAAQASNQRTMPNDEMEPNKTSGAIFSGRMLRLPMAPRFVLRESRRAMTRAKVASHTPWTHAKLDASGTLRSMLEELGQGKRCYSYPLLNARHEPWLRCTTLQQHRHTATVTAPHQQAPAARPLHNGKHNKEHRVKAACITKRGGKAGSWNRQRVQHEVKKHHASQTS